MDELIGLFIEDEAANVDIYTRLFALEGLKLDCLDKLPLTVDSYYDIILEKNVDFLIIDFHLEKQVTYKGIDVLREIRKHDSTIYAVLLTNYELDDFICNSCAKVKSQYVDLIYDLLKTGFKQPVYGKLGYSIIKTKKSINKHFFEIHDWDFYYYDGNVAKKAAILSQIDALNCYILEDSFDDYLEKNWENIMNSFVSVNIDDGKADYNKSGTYDVIYTITFNGDKLRDCIKDNKMKVAQLLVPRPTIALAVKPRLKAFLLLVTTLLPRLTRVTTCIPLSRQPGTKTSGKVATSAMVVVQPSHMTTMPLSILQNLV